jgi:hypothetical protein
MSEKITGVCLDIPQLIGLLNECKNKNTPILIVSGENEDLILERKFFRELRADNAIILSLKREPPK